MRVIVDTNVLISGIFWSGPPYQILDAWRQNKIKLVASSEILDEYSRILQLTSIKYKAINISEFMELLAVSCDFYTPIKLKTQICEDPDDDKFIACALSANCKIIVSGDKHLLKVSGYENIEVVKAAQFVKEYLK